MAKSNTQNDRFTLFYELDKAWIYISRKLKDGFYDEEMWWDYSNTRCLRKVRVNKSLNGGQSMFFLIVEPIEHSWCIERCGAI